MMKVVSERQDMTRKIEKMAKNSITKVWQKGVDDEGGEEGEAGDDKEDTEDGEEQDICSLTRGSR